VRVLGWAKAGGGDGVVGMGTMKTMKGGEEAKQGRESEGGWWE